MLMTRSSRLAIEALVQLADLGSHRWITSEGLSRNTTGDLNCPGIAGDRIP